MQSIIGKWRLAAAPTLTDDGVVWIDAQTLRETAIEKQDKDQLMLLDMLLIFEPDGKLIRAMKLPEGISREEIEQAVQAGAIQLYGEDRFIGAGENETWRMENGVPMYDTGIHGEAFGEPTSPWVEITFTDDGMMELPLMRLEKITE